MSYLYRVENKLTGEFYIGSRYSYEDIESDLWVVYFTSSRYVKNLIKKYGKETFIPIIIKIFNDKELCFREEQDLIYKLIKDPYVLISIILRMARRYSYILNVMKKLNLKYLNRILVRLDLIYPKMKENDGLYQEEIVVYYPNQK